MTTAEYAKLSWRDLAVACLEKHKPDTMPEFWLLVGAFASNVGHVQQVPEKMLEIMGHALAFRDAEIVELLTRMVNSGRIRGA